MNTDIFASLLFGNDDEAIEKYIKSDEMQSQIEVSAALSAIVHVLITKGLLKEDEFGPIKKTYKEIVEKEAIKNIKDQLNKYKEEENNGN